MRAKVCIVEDDPDILLSLENRFRFMGYKEKEVVCCTNGRDALQLIRGEEPDLILTDFKIPELNGLELIKQARQHNPDLCFIVMTAYGSMELATECIRSGATDFLAKPFTPEAFYIAVERALERVRLRRQVHILQREQRLTFLSYGAITEVLALAKQVAPTDVSLLLVGEHGTGKELLARSIHQWSPRSDKLFLAVNCAAYSESHLGNLLFGHEKGAFTGADRMVRGRVEIADGGTLFLDRIEDMPLSMQNQLLRMLQDGTFYRVGGPHELSVGVRFIAATNKDLRSAVKAGQFREDLYFRLNVITLTLPTLRESLDDIEGLASDLLRRHGTAYNKPGIKLGEAALQSMKTYHWPGNIRELEQRLILAIQTTTGSEIGREALWLSPDSRLIELIPNNQRHGATAICSPSSQAIQKSSALQNHGLTPIYPFIMGGLLHNALNTITSILFQLDQPNLAQKPCDAKGDHKPNAAVQNIIPTARHLSVLLQVMQQLTRGFYAKGENYSVNSQIQAAISSFIEGNPAITYHCTVPTALDHISMPAGVSTFIVGELLKNATKACSDRQGATIRLTVEVTKHMDRLSFECQDSGAGFSDEMLVKIRSQELRRPSRSKQVGGYGLYLIQELTLRLQGELLVSNQESGGARIQVLLPLTVQKSQL